MSPSDAHRHGLLDPSLGGSAREGFWTRNGFRIAAVSACLVLLILAAVLLVQKTRSRQVVITAGAEGLTYLPLARGLESILESSFEVEVLPSSGSPQNATRVLTGQADLGLVQNDVGSGEEAAAICSDPGLAADRQVAGDTPGACLRKLRTIAVLYDEVLQVLVRRSLGIGSLKDLEGRVIYLGKRNSGSSRLARNLLLHYGFVEDQDYESRYADAVPDVDQGFRSGQIDAAFILTGLTASMVGTLLKAEDISLLSLDGGGEGSLVQGLTLELPGTKPAEIPAHTYGSEPREAIRSLAVEALLVTSSGQSVSRVREITEAIFQNRYALAQVQVAASQIQELKSSEGLRFSIHPGAESFYARNEPPFVVRYAETLSFIVTFLLSAVSGIWAFRGLWRRRRKQRIDKYYMRVDELADLMSEATEETLLEIRHQLLDTRRAAFHDLVGEKIRADPSFLIFQDFLSQLLLEIRQTIEIRSNVRQTQNEPDALATPGEISP